MSQQPKKIFTEKQELHPRNRHRSRYDFPQLIASCPELASFVSLNKFNNDSVDFANPEAVKILNRALLKHFYEVDNWDIPKNYLCPPIPGRADYIHYVADLLASSNDGVIPRGGAIKLLDIGVGANCVYPIIGHKEYGWHFVGSDIDPVAIRWAKQIVAANSSLAGSVECRLQTSQSGVFTGIVMPGELFDASICNPPFHSSLEEAQAGTQRKIRNLKLGNQRDKLPVLNFGGQPAELWCEGGEERFIRNMIAQSALMPTQCFWFSTLVSKKTTLPGVYNALKKVNVVEVKTIQMAQGQKESRIVAWTFLKAAQQQEWREKRWKGE